MINQQLQNKTNPDGSAKRELVPFNANDERDLYDASASLLNSKEFIADLHSLADSVEGMHYEERRLRRRKTVKLRNYIAGNYLGYVDDSGRFVDKSDKGDGLYYDTEVGTYVEVLLASISKARPTIKITAMNENDIRQREIARVAQIEWEMIRERFSDPKKLQKEIKFNFIAAGETYRYTFFNQSLENCGYDKKTYNPKLVGKNESVTVCLDCKASGREEMEEPAENEALEIESPEQESPQHEWLEEIAPESGEETEENETENSQLQESDACASCGSPKIFRYTRRQNKIEIEEGREYQQIGDADCDFIDALEMNVVTQDGCDDIGDALAVQRNRLIPRCVLLDAFEIENLPSTEIPYYLRYKIRSQSSTAYLYENGGGIEKELSSEFEEIHYQETWLSTKVYSRKKFGQDTQLRNGSVIPKGTKYTDVFPHGICFARAGRTPLNLYGQAVKECLTHAVNSVGENFHGIGEWDLSAQGDQLNEIQSMKMNSLLKDSTSPLIVRGEYLEGGQLQNKFGAIAYVKTGTAKELRTGDIASRIEPSPGIPEAYNLANDLRSRMQNRVGAMTSTGAAGADMEAVAKTASAYRLWYEHTLGRRGPMLALRAALETEQAWQVLGLKQKYHPPAMFARSSEEVSDEAVMWFLDSNLKRDIKIEVVPDSWMPQTESQKKLEFREFLDIIAPIVAAKPELIDGILKKTGEMYRSFDLTDHISDSTEAQIRLEKLLDIAGYIEQRAANMNIPLFVPSPQNTPLPNPRLIEMAMAKTAQILKIVHTGEDELFALYPLDVMFDDHKEFEKVYKDHLVTPQGRRASVFVRACINHLAIAHKKAGFDYVRRMKELENATQLPDLEAEMIADEAMNNQKMKQTEQMHEQSLKQNEDVHEQSLRHDGERQIQTGGIQMIGDAIAQNTGGEST